MTIFERIFGRRAHDGEEFFAIMPPAEIIDATRPTIRAETLAFAMKCADAGFTDDDLVSYLDRPDTPRTTLLGPRMRLVREGWIIADGYSTNDRGNRVILYRPRTWATQSPPPKRLTYAQLRRKATTLELENTVLKSQLAAFQSQNEAI